MTYRTHRRLQKMQHLVASDQFDQPHSTDAYTAQQPADASSSIHEQPHFVQFVAQQHQSIKDKSSVWIEDHR
ncbi:hypothetical protein SERLA73DRAFT_124196 [Serpula lacrymans var. lacrymans S7.3]|uniref:Uncharacterized protein n=2 Tax=Serpula lacrymans var. lacrymans TaxID=341189 RepID=F8Q2U6_SERL3|nr:uncharacterized protein SERLADRAFT_371353 [Serpula lacrymans var. lacrymans S7.9]EGN97507.1 hypothetical protein SERLA73DRAFT_124196 [Serpula lacrymans var. lacrymans S7.3]EGO23108.1 hypothetical protein SERLADRAFT_371353 [Serpula lacrymans var. lacrymans S7.9]